MASSLAVKSESEEMSTAPNLSGGRGALAVLACRVPLGVGGLELPRPSAGAIIHNSWWPIGFAQGQWDASRARGLALGST
jgi:hypothetical protein